MGSLSPISISSSSTVTRAATAVATSLQSSLPSQHHVLKSLPLILWGDRVALRLAAACNQGLEFSTDSVGSRAVAVYGERPCSMRGKKNNSSVVVRAAGLAAEETSVAAPGIELEDLKNKGDSYFLTDSRPVILFDGVCNMCNGGVNFMLDNDSVGKVRFAALQSNAGRALLVKSGRAPDDISSIVLVDSERSYIKSEAILRIARCLNFPYPPAAFLGFMFPLFLRDPLYDTVADNRYSVFGRTDVCRLSDSRFAERFIE